MLDILVAWFAYFLYMNLPVNVWIKTMRVAHSIFFGSRWQYYTSHSTTEWWLASIGISNSAGLIASLFFSPSFFFIYWSLDLIFRKHLSFCILGFICACVSSAGKGEKSQLVPLKHNFSEDFQKFQIWFWYWPCTRPFKWDLVLSLSI